jgi:hypothetical protein
VGVLLTAISNETYNVSSFRCTILSEINYRYATSIIQFVKILKQIHQLSPKLSGQTWSVFLVLFP